MMAFVHLPLSQLEAEGTQDIVVSDLDRAGFMLNVIKTHLEPVQIINCLGFVII